MPLPVVMDRMPFGRHQGLPLAELPDAYLHWLTTIRLRSPLQEAVEAERRRRQGAASDAAPAASPIPPPRAVDLVELGWRAAAKQHHPDVGGTNEAMREILAARDWLREVVGAA
jgi:hypothetical protein